MLRATDEQVLEQARIARWEGTRVENNLDNHQQPNPESSTC